MTKKIFAMFLAVLMVVSMLPTSVFAANECPAVHTKNNCEYTQVGEPVAPTCGTKGYTTYKCNACGDTFVADFVDEVGEHDWKDADPVKETCEVNGSVGGKECKVCHKVVNATTVDEIPNGLKCEYGEWTPATFDCTEGAIQNRYCKHCGGKDPEPREYKAQDDHKMGAWELKTPATAEADGLAVQKCDNPNCNYAIEQVVFFDHDHNDTTLVKVLKEEAKCTENGVKEHYKCRVCGNLFELKSGEYKPTTLADLKTETKHEEMQRKELSCKLVSKLCNDCNEVVKIDAAKAHDYGSWTVTAPSCLSNGFRQKACKKCGHTESELIDALSHDTKTVEVAATCVSYAFSYTYCTRPGCTFENEVELPEEHAAYASKYAMVEHVLESVSAPAADTGFYLALYQNNPYVQLPLYFTGEMDGNFYAASSDYRDAVKVYTEIVEGGFYLYFKNGDAKTYLDLEGYVKSNNKNGAAVKLTTKTPKAKWSVHSTGALVATVAVSETANAEFVLCTYQEYKTISASATADYPVGTNGNYYAKLNKVEKFEAAKVISYAISKAAGVDTTDAGHDWDVLSEVEATCLAEGIKISTCPDCNAVKNETLSKVDHNWIVDTDLNDSTKGIVAGVKAATCTTAGVKYMKCSYDGCTESKEEPIAATGHDLDKNADGTAKVHTNAGSHTNPVAYDYNKCSVCGEVNKTNYKAWADAGKIWDVLDCGKTGEEACKKCATCAHGALTKTTTVVEGSCTVPGYEAYTCGDANCKDKTVRVKISGTGEHKFVPFGEYDVAHKDATCTDEGWHIIYKCDVCKKWIDGNTVVEDLEEPKVTELDMIAHDWTEFTTEQREALDWLDDTYTKSDCKNPRYDNWTHYCKNCNYDATTKTIGTKKEGLKADQNEVEKPNATGALCEAVIYELYECHCGKTHMRSFLSKIGHNMTAAEDVPTTEAGAEVGADGKVILKKDSTCYDEGYEWKVCTFCDKLEKTEIAKKAHKNEAKEEWTDSCLDDEKVTDRHCVECHKHYCEKQDEKNHTCASYKDENGDTVPACKCMVAKDQHVNVVSRVDSICGDAAYTSTVCSVCYETVAEHADKYVSGYDNEGKPEMAPVFGLGHKPVVGEADGEEFGAYDYVPGYKHYTYQWVNVAEEGEEAKYELHQFVETYKAKFIEYTAPTYTAEGFAKFVCEDCHQTIEQVLPAKSGVEFKVEVKNALGVEGFTYGSLVEVIVSVNGNNADIHGFDFQIAAGDIRVDGTDTAAKFVGYEKLNENFNFVVTAPENTLYAAAVSGFAVNNASGKQQNITINGKTELVKLYFRIAECKDAAKYAAIFLPKTVTKLENGKGVDMLGSTDFVKADFDVRGYLDFNNDGFRTNTDLYLAMSMITLEHADGKTYDVTVDVNKDGVVDLQDLSIAYNRSVGNYDYEDLLVMGISAEEVELLNLNEKTFCNSSACGKEIDADAVYCPFCGNHQ